MTLMLGRTSLLLLISIGFVANVPREKSYQTGLLSFAEWDLNKDCIVTYDEYKNWVLDMLMTVYTYQALVKAEERSSSDLKESTYDSVAIRIIDNLSRLATQKANVTKVMYFLLSGLYNKLEHKYNGSIARIFKFNSRINLTFWYNI